MSSENIYDVLGIGFGPANLALAIALREMAESDDGVALNVGFIERQKHFFWHPSLLLPGSQLQVSPLKDLATMRSPTSSYTFINYLHQQGRLSAWINREANIPTRREWSAYLTWAAKRMDDVVTYDQEVIKIEPVRGAEIEGQADHVRLLKVTSRSEDGTLSTRLTRNLTVAVGGVARVPAQFLPHYPADPWLATKVPSRVVHSGTFLPSLLRIKNDLLAIASPRFAVIGSGQSSSEMALYLYKTFPGATVSLIFRASAIVPSDDSPFVNAAAFDPERTDSFWRSGVDERSAALREFKRTNYSCVRSDVLNELNDLLYDQSLELPAPFEGAAGPEQSKMELLANTMVEAVSVDDANGRRSVHLTLSPTKAGGTSAKAARYDAVFLGTGFERRPSSMRFLSPLAPYFPSLRDAARNTRPIVSPKNVAAHPDADPQSQEFMEPQPDTDDERVLERWRERTRGITRDYRLVSYFSSAFREEEGETGASGPSSRGISPERTADQAAIEGVVSMASSVTLDDGGLVSPPHDGSGDRDAFEPSIYVFGGNEATHGLSDSLLSIVAWRAGEVCESMVRRLPARILADDVNATARRFSVDDKAAAPQKQLATSPQKPSHALAPPVSPPSVALTTA